MREKRSLIFAGVEIVHAVSLMLIVKIVAPVCSGMVETAAGKQIPMKCHYTSVALLFFGILCAVRKELLVCGVMASVISILAVLTLSSSVGIGICMNPEMACNYTAPFVKILGAIGIIIGIVSVYVGIHKK